MNRYTVNNPKAPKLNAQIKIHKENKPIRPVINFTRAPYKISKIIADELKNKINRNNDHSIKNSMELTDRISTTNVSPNTKLFSFDIKNMYFNIPVNESINIISEKLKHQNIDKTYINQMEPHIAIDIPGKFHEYTFKDIVLCYEYAMDIYIYLLENIPGKCSWRTFDIF